MPTATSRSKVNSASSSRPLRTNSFPARTTSGSPPFATNANRLPPSGKYRWCDCIVVTITRSGSRRNRSSNDALLHARPLDEVHDLVQLAERVAPRAERVEAGDDLLEANRAVGLDARRTQRWEVVAGGGDLDGARMRLAVPVRDAPARHALEGDVDRLVVELGEEPAHGPREPEARAPRHRLAELQAGDDGREALGQHLRDRPPWHLQPQEPVADGQVVDRRAVALREPCGGAVAQGLGRALDPLVGRSLRKTRGKGEATRPDEERVGDRAEVLAREVRELQPGLHARGCGQLLAADLKQQRRHAPLPLPAAARGTAARPTARDCGHGRCTRRAP